MLLYQRVFFLHPLLLVAVAVAVVLDQVIKVAVLVLRGI
jgi:hypothetical protein